MFETLELFSQSGLLKVGHGHCFTHESSQICASNSHASSDVRFVNVERSARILSAVSEVVNVLSYMGSSRVLEFVYKFSV